MISADAATLALRNRALGLVVCTTGSTTLSATPAGYARATGSFLADGFAVGMELQASGFSAANNGYAVVTSVSALTLGVSCSRTAQAAASGRTLTVGLPEGRAWENVEFTPVKDRPWIEEAFVPATSSLRTFSADNGQVEETGLYVIRWHGLSGKGPAAIRRSVDALKARFAPGTTLDVGGDPLRIRADTGPYTGSLIRVDGGWSVLTLTIPWLARSTNAITA